VREDLTKRRPDLLRAMILGLEGARDAAPPRGWAAVVPHLLVSPDAKTRSAAAELDALFGNAESLAALRREVAGVSQTTEQRRRALEILIQRRAAGLQDLLERLLSDKELASDAVEGLGAIGAAEAPALLIGRFVQMNPQTRRVAISTLISRPAWILPLLQAVQRGVIDRKAIGASQLRQLRGIDLPEVKEKVAAIWPAAAGSEGGSYARYRALLSTANLRKADPAKGREQYQVSCASCHKLYGEGATIGPELTGADRQNVDYLLENILSPSGVVPDAYRISDVEMKDGRTLSGIVLASNEETITLQTLTDKLTLSRSEIDSLRELGLSMMPDGLLESLSDQQVLDLIAYLGSSAPSSTQSRIGE
jgi:putative heme-binding domain-containing protein